MMLIWLKKAELCDGSLGNNNPAANVEELTPRVWKTTFAANFLTSDLDSMA